MFGKEPSTSTTESQLILIADDEIPITEILSDLVTDLGYEPIIAHNGQQALTLARTHWPCLIITDFMMPILNGTELVRILQKEATTLKRALPPIILLSAANPSIPSDIRISAVLTKPFDLDELDIIISKLLKT